MTGHPHTYVQDLQAYQPGMSIEELARLHKLDITTIAKLASNENPYGPGPNVRAAIEQATKDGNRYPDTYQLAEALAKHHQLDAGNVVLGNGSNDVLDLIARVYLGPDTNAVSSQYAFLVYPLVTLVAGANNIVVDASQHGHDLAAMSEAINDKTRVVWIANPNNPTGTFISYDRIKAFIETVPDDVIIVLDEAYYDYLSDEDSRDSVGWLSEHQNLILVRTFSKIYGLAGFRIGYALAGSEIAELLNRTRQPFNVNSLGIVAALAALQDTDHITISREQNSKGVALLRAELDKRDITYLPTYGNFITMRVPSATELYQNLLRQGVIVRPLANYGLDEYLRVSVGTPAENAKFIEALSALV